MFNTRNNMFSLEAISCFVLGIFLCIILLIFIGASRYFFWFYFRKCRSCGHHLHYRGCRNSKDDEDYYLFHCKHCHSWEKITKSAFLSELGINRDEEE